MYGHLTSEAPSGFFARVERGTWMGHIIEHIALEIQTLAGMETGFGRTRETKTPGTYNVVFSYVEENVGIYAAEASVRIAEALIAGTEYDLDADIQEMRRIRERDGLDRTGSIVEEAVSRTFRGYAWEPTRWYELGYGINQMRFQATITNKTSHIAVDIACNKEQTKRMLEAASIPVASGGICSTEEGLKEIIDKIGYPIVLKPLDGNHGKGASINVKTFKKTHLRGWSCQNTAAALL
jgi:cyanophycin synthetase